MENKELDLASGWWTIPAQKSKNDRAHRVLLTALAVKILEQPIAAAGDSPYVFPALAEQGASADIEV